MSKHALITLAMLKSLQPTGVKPDYIIRDTQLRGFGIRVSAGSVSFFVQKKMLRLVVKKITENGVERTVDTYVRKPTKRTLGFYSGGGRGEQLTLVQARARAQDWLGKMSRGLDPEIERDRTAKKTADAVAEKAATFGKAFRDFCDARKESSAAGTIKDREKAISELEGKPLFAMPFKELDSAAVEAALRPIFAHSQSNGWRCYRWCRVAYKIAASKQKIHGNPFTDWRAEKKPRQVPGRTVLLKTESPGGKKFLRALRRLRRHEKQVVRIAADYILILLLLGTRKTETQLLKKSDLDFIEGTAMLREETTKTRVPRRVPLGSFSSKILRERIRDNDKESDWIFPSVKQSKRIVDVRVTLYEANKAAGFKQNDIRLHDLRRTFASELLAESAGNLFLVKAALGHTRARSDISAKYLDEHEILRQLRPLIERREKRLESLTK